MINQSNQSAKSSKVLRTILFWVIFCATVTTIVLYFVRGWNTALVELKLTWLSQVISSVFTFIIALSTQRIAKLLLTKFAPKSQRGRTISALLSSIIKYAIAIVACFLILTYFLGESYMTELIAGLGVVALVIGLGCQQLISDIVAGVFMVFEGQFQVGDIVVIDSWRGTVNEIGLRTTVIEDGGGNFQIINNSKISKVINNSKALSLATCDFGIEYGESIERVENIINDNIDNIKSKLPAVVEGPYYKGVQELGASSVVLRIVAKCHEEDKFQVQRDINREFKLMFDKNGIKIPFPQVTVSKLDDQYGHFSEKDKQQADTFVNSQRDASRHIEKD